MSAPRHATVSALVLAMEKALAKQGAKAITSTWYAPHVCETKATMADGSVAQVITDVHDGRT